MGIEAISNLLLGLSTSPVGLSRLGRLPDSRSASPEPANGEQAERATDDAVVVELSGGGQDIKEASTITYPNFTALNKRADQQAGAQQGDSSGVESNLNELRYWDAKVREHEKAHQDALGKYRNAIEYTFTRGADGFDYAIGGRIAVDMRPEETPEATVRKARTIREAALAPDSPSSADRLAAALATKMEAEGLAKLDSEQRKLLEAEENVSEVSSEVVEKTASSLSSWNAAYLLSGQDSNLPKADITRYSGNQPRNLGSTVNLSA